MDINLRWHDKETSSVKSVHESIPKREFKGFSMIIAGITA